MSEQAKSRPQRWAEAVSRCRSALNALQGYLDDFDGACIALAEVQQEYVDWKENLPENLASSALGEKLEAVCDLDIEGPSGTLLAALEEACGVIDEAESIDLPRGFGKD